MKVKKFFRASRGRIATTHTGFASGRTTQIMLPTGLTYFKYRQWTCMHVLSLALTLTVIECFNFIDRFHEAHDGTVFTLNWIVTPTIKVHLWTGWQKNRRNVQRQWFHSFGSDHKCDQSSALQYVKTFNETISYLPWWMYGYDEVRATHTATCSLYIIPVRYQTSNGRVYLI